MCDCRNPLWTKPYYELFVRKPPGKYKRTDNAVTQGWNVTFLVIGAYSTGALLKYTSVIICQYHNWHFTRFELIPVYSFQVLSGIQLYQASLSEDTVPVQIWNTVKQVCWLTVTKRQILVTYTHMYLCNRPPCTLHTFGQSLLHLH